MKLFKLGETNAQFRMIQFRTNPTNSFQWQLCESNNYVDLEQSIIQISKNTAHVPENICIATTISMAFVLCQPRPPPPKDSKTENAAYPAPPADRPGVLNLDAMKFLVASGLYASNLPRWYHTNCRNGYFCQIHPDFYHKLCYNFDHHDENDDNSNYLLDAGSWDRVTDKTGGCGGCGGFDDEDGGCGGCGCGS